MLIITWSLSAKSLFKRLQGSVSRYQDQLVTASHCSSQKGSMSEGMASSEEINISPLLHHLLKAKIQAPFGSACLIWFTPFLEFVIHLLSCDYLQNHRPWIWASTQLPHMYCCISACMRRRFYCWVHPGSTELQYRLHSRLLSSSAGRQPPHNCNSHSNNHILCRRDVVHLWWAQGRATPKGQGVTLSG